MNLESSRNLLKELYECAKDAGISEKVFISFGTLLGAVREKGLIEHDTDLDVCILPISTEEKQLYYNICKERGLMDGWKHPSSRIGKSTHGEIFWFSAKKSRPETKCCNWFMFKWNKLMWHTKGPLSQRYSMVTDVPVARWFAKGAKAEYFKELVPIKFLDIDVNVPKMTGSLLDFWYPNWLIPVYEGASCNDIIGSIKYIGKKLDWIME